MGLRETDLLWSAASYDQPTALLQEGDAVTGHAQTAALRVGVTVNVDDDVDDGWLRFDDVTLVKVGDPFAVTAALPYWLEAQVSGELDAPGGELGGRLYVAYFDGGGDGALGDSVFCIVRHD